jgi:diacylglycerol kinase family enzyme
VTVIVQNSDPFTYFGRARSASARARALDSGTLSLAVLKRATPLEMPTLIPRVFPDRLLPEVSRATVRSVDERPFPLQVDGDHIGEFTSVEYGVEPLALTAVS